MEYINQTSSGNGTSYLTSDTLSSTRIVTDANGVVKSRHDYLPFGEELTAGIGGRTTSLGYSVADGVRMKFTGAEREDETGLDFMQARYYSSPQGRFTSPDPFSFQKEMLTDPQRFNLYAYVRNNPVFYVDPTGMIIDTSRLSKGDLEKWRKVLGIINAKDDKGNYLNPKLHEVYERLNSNERTFFITNFSFGENSGTVGKFEITKHNGKNDFSEAVLKLDFEKIEHIEHPTKSEYVSGHNKYEGLIGETPELRAELFGHEGSHAVYALDNTAEAVRLQMLLDGRDAAMKGKKAPFPPDLVKKMQEADEGLIPTERFAQQQSQIINQELRAYLKVKKK